MDYAALIQMAMSMAGEMGASMSEGQAQQILERAYQEFGKIDPPAIESIMAKLGPGQMEQLKADPSLQGAERQSLDELLRIGRSGGMTLEDKANLNAIHGQAARQARSSDARVREDMAARGISGGGQELAMRMAGNQAAAQRASDEGLNVAAQAQRRSLDSILQGGRLAGQMNERDFGQRHTAASAADARARYNEDARVRGNQQVFGNRMSIAARRAGQGGNLVDFLGGQAAGRRAQGRGAGQALGNLVPSGGYKTTSRESSPVGYDNSGTPYYSEPDEWDLPGSF